MAPQFVTKVCRGCGKEFQTSNDSDKCYNCTLEDICHGNPPEEGEFNTARIVSGTLSAQEYRYLQQDWGSVELGRTTEEELGLGEEEDEEYYPDEEEEPDDWEYNENEAAKWGDEG
ncbi:MAG: hypothetical protein A2919_01105 [Candidatus Spechtbacteria bacterium RIFCSPLOWO2_01_FULL_43_12]|uniref:Uncharacterized protein n=1 Tax=Candidatus Spechtbacteria bacterium RIFCSPLOWO2_01_FULL_43_12 TaxID=1802162 RepID=A0A1G2HE16_9BACT|nr:MAG: hypothetical protein A2919_01105 [Candidatus Spechtbacteria bacterium RIFCSPLOWO2_01_FULL_43_12]